VWLLFINQKLIPLARKIKWIVLGVFMFLVHIQKSEIPFRKEETITFPNLLNTPYAHCS